MPTFRVIGRTPKAKRRRVREYRAFDATKAQQLAEQEGTLVDTVELVPGPSAALDLRELATQLGINLPENSSHIEAAILVLTQLAELRRKAEVDYRSLHRTIEPYGLVRSFDGLRLRCWVDEPDDLPEVIGENEAGGWRHWLIDDIGAIRDTGIEFEFHPERQREPKGEIVLSIGVTPELQAKLAAMTDPSRANRMSPPTES
jgi:hypothetical protein